METRDGAGNIMATNAYDANGLEIAEGNQFGVLRTAYDTLGNAIRLTNSLNQVIESAYDPNGQITNLVEGSITSVLQYDAQGRNAFATYGNGITLSNSYNSQLDWNSVDGPTIGHIERGFDPQGRLSTWKAPNGSKPGFAYDAAGRLEYETNSAGTVIHSTYDSAGQLVAVTNFASGAGIRYGYDAASRRIAETNALGHVARFDYYPDGSLKAVTNAFGTNSWNFAYDTGAGCCGGSGGTSSTMTDPLGREFIDLRSPLGLPLESIRRLGTNAVTNTTVYLSGVVSGEEDGEDYPVTITDEGGRTRNFGYTSLGLLDRASDLSGANYWTNRYAAADGALLEIISPTGETNSFTYDELDNRKTIRFADGSVLTNYYNVQNLVASNRLPSGITVQYLYDLAGRLTNRISTIGETASFVYNNFDAVTRMTDNTGSTTNLFDAAGRLAGIDFPSGSSVRYELNKLDRITAITNRVSATGMPYVTRYAYDAVGNVTNITDPFQGQTNLEYDRINRRTKRTLPNGVTTEWQYNWRDQVTNIVHKNSGATVLASVAYERAPFGEPTKITREDGSYVVLKYDSALRHTNEQHYASGGGLLEDIGYGYDASGTRVRLSNNSGVFTNHIEKGFRITAVRNQSTGSTNESYGYDAGGRVVSIGTAQATLALGYNTADQVAAVTNGATWIQFTYDAAGRLGLALDQSGSQRRFTVARAAGASLESPHLIADANSTLKQGYVYLGDQPILRFDPSGSSSRVYYLEDGMGSVIGLAPHDTPTTANTSRIFYDGFGTTRGTNGPAPTTPSGVGGDFRFHRAWWEAGSGLYHMRARDYHPGSGRFFSRDPVEGDMREPESLHPYAYAHNNPHVYADPSGEFSLSELSVAQAIQFTLHTIRAVGVAVGRHKAMKAIRGFVVQQVIDVIFAYLPDSLFDDALKHVTGGIAFENLIRETLCVADVGWFYFEPGVRQRDGMPQDNGLNCQTRREKVTPKTGVRRPDIIFGRYPPTDALGNANKTWLVGEIKLRQSSLDHYNKPKRKPQLQAIARYAGKHTTTRAAAFLSFTRGNKTKANIGRTLVQKECSSHGAIGVVVTLDPRTLRGKR